MKIITKIPLTYMNKLIMTTTAFIKIKFFAKKSTSMSLTIMSLLKSILKEDLDISLLDTIANLSTF